MTPTPPAENPPHIHPFLVTGGLVVGLALIGLGAYAGEEPTAPASPAPAAIAQPAEAAAVGEAPAAAAPAATPAESSGASDERLDALEGGEEGAIAEPDQQAPSLSPTSARVPAYSNLAPLPPTQDFLARARLENGRYVVDTEQGKKTLTVDPELQQKLTDLLKLYKIPYGAVTAIDPSTGRVLAMAEHSEEDAKLRGLNLRAIYPAASIFKTVSAAALLEKGLSADDKACYHGGKRRLQKKLLADSRRDYRCSSLATALGHSLNVVIAKLAARTLDAKSLKRWADRFGFNTPWSFPEPLEVSPAVIPEDEFGLATAAAGFGEVLLSPMHGAMLAGTVGNKGVMMSPVLFEGDASTPRQVLTEPMAKSLSDMLELTVTEGTARRAFRERGRYVLGDVQAAGKTGSLAEYKPVFRDFTWFVGYAPRDNPKIAVAAVMVNGRYWKVKGPYVAREAMRMFLMPQPVKAVKPARKAKGNRTARR